MSDTIRLKQVVAEDFCNYKLPSMFLITCFCDWKCCTEGNFDTSVCQNFSLKDYPIKEYPFILLYKFYMSNPITKAIIVGGLEPLLQSEELYNLISFIFFYISFAFSILKSFKEKGHRLCYAVTFSHLLVTDLLIASFSASILARTSSISATSII